MCLISTSTPKVTPAPPPPPPPAEPPKPVEVGNGAGPAAQVAKKRTGRNSLRIGLSVPGNDTGSGLSIPSGV